MAADQPPGKHVDHTDALGFHLRSTNFLRVSTRWCFGQKSSPGGVPGQTTSPQCEPCVTVDPVDPGVPDELSGVYRSQSRNIEEPTKNDARFRRRELLLYLKCFLRFLMLDSECPGSCAYTRDGESEDQVYCFGPGPRTGAFECAAISSTTGQFSFLLNISSIQSLIDALF